METSNFEFISVDLLELLFHFCKNRQTDMYKIAQLATAGASSLSNFVAAAGAAIADFTIAIAGMHPT